MRMLGAQLCQDVSRQPGDVAIGGRHGLPVGQLGRWRGTKAEQVAGLELHREIQIRITQAHGAAQNQAQLVRQMALRHQRGPRGGAAQSELTGQRVTAFGTELGKNPLPGQVADEQGRVFGRGGHDRSLKVVRAWHTIFGQMGEWAHCNVMAAACVCFSARRPGRCLPRSSARPENQARTRRRAPPRTHWMPSARPGCR